ncbi:replication-relaxation family protein [bacterium]|nr:replication-relaxation family protein [bacterium]
MPSHRFSRYTKPPENVRPPLRLTQNDISLLQLFGPQKYGYLTAATIAHLAERNRNYVQHRLARLWYHDYVGRWHEAKDYTRGGSNPCVYWLDQRGADLLRRRYKQRAVAKDLDSGYHPHLKHSVLVDWVRAAVKHALMQHGGLQLHHEIGDKRFVDRFQAHAARMVKGKEVHRKASFKICPDWTFALTGWRNRNKLPRSPEFYFLELQRSNRVTKNPHRHRSRHKSLRHKLESYYYFYKTKRWQDWSEKKKEQLPNFQNFRVLFVVEMGDEEMQNLIKLACEIDEKKHGLRLFLFININSLKTNPDLILQPVWQTPVIGDPLCSILQ